MPREEGVTFGGVAKRILGLVLLIGITFAAIVAYGNNRDEVHAFFGDKTAGVPEMEPWQLVTSPIPADSAVWTSLRKFTAENIDLRIATDPCELSMSDSPNAVWGCVSNTAPGVIYFTPNIVDLDAEQLDSMVAHELGHVYQLKLSGDFLGKNETVIAAFPEGAERPEQLADCMAYLRTNVHTGVYIDNCTEEQLRIARLVWGGTVPEPAGAS